jgi:sialic acid synthase SpsE
MTGKLEELCDEPLVPPSLPAIRLSPTRQIGNGEPCLLVAEVGQNHNGEMLLARELIERIAGHADAVKLCKRHIPSELTQAAYQRPYLGPHSFGSTYGEHRQFLELSPRQYAELQALADARNLIFFATACDARSVDDLEGLDVPLYKVASRDLTNLPLLDAIGRTYKPVVLSCGMDGLVEIAEALETIRRYHDQVVLLQCTSAYPTDYRDVHLRVLAELRRRFDVHVGLSDHTAGGAVAVAAVALGAVIIEKHVTLDRRLPGTDHACSLEIDEWAALARDVRRVELALGDGVKRVPQAVDAARQKLGRCLVSTHAIPRGTRLTADLLCVKSGGPGLLWRQRGRLVGRLARRDIAADELLSEADFD